MKWNVIFIARMVYLVHIMIQRQIHVSGIRGHAGKTSRQLEA